MSTIIAFSGASNSGKTTLMNVMEKYCIEKHGEGSCKVLGEVIRKEPIDIDKIRENGSEYLQKQLQWTGEKMRMERELFWEDNPRLVLIDRSLADSLFYINFYTNKSQLSFEETKRFVSFYKEVSFTLKNHMKSLYDYVFMPEPIKRIKQDNYRSNMLGVLQDIEFNEILKNTNHNGEAYSNVIIDKISNFYYDFEKRELAAWVTEIINK